VLRAYIANPVIQALATAAAAAAAAAEASGGMNANAGGKLKSGDGDDAADADAASSSSTALATRGTITPSSASASSSAARGAPADARDTRRASGLNKLTSSLANRIKQLTTAGVGAASSSAATIAGGVSMAISLPSHPTLQVFFLNFWFLVFGIWYSVFGICVCVISQGFVCLVCWTNQCALRTSAMLL
jgi:hypothetical protein